MGSCMVRVAMLDSVHTLRKSYKTERKQMKTKTILITALHFIMTNLINAQNQRDTLMVKQSYLKELAPLSKTYQKGDSGSEVRKIEEWLMLWQLNENYVDVILELDSKFDDKTEKTVKEIQKFIGLKPTGVVDSITWQALINPLKESFDLNSYRHQSVREKMKYFATKHMQFRSSELDEDNIGPWIRSYMDSNDGGWAYWCQGFVCTILDQTFTSIGKRFNLYYPNTWACETMRKHARNRGLLVTTEELQKGKYLPQEGDMVLYIGINGIGNEAHHIEIIYEILDQEKGDMLTIGGNTNFIGSRNGVGTFLVNRNFFKKNVEIIKIDDSQKVDSFPQNVKKLMISYPEQILNYVDNQIIFKDGTKLLFDDHKKKSPEELLKNPSINDQFHYPYEKGVMKQKPRAYIDPGRITNEMIFKTMYGETKEEVEQKLEEIVWCPKLSGQKLKVTTVNGIHNKLKAISAQLDKHPELKPYVSDIGGTYKWRKVAGT